MWYLFGTYLGRQDIFQSLLFFHRPIYPWKPRKRGGGGGGGRGNRRCTDSTGAVIPCANDGGDAGCFDQNGIRIPGCIGSGSEVYSKSVDTTFNSLLFHYSIAKKSDIYGAFMLCPSLAITYLLSLKPY